MLSNFKQLMLLNIVRSIQRYKDVTALKVYSVGSYLKSFVIDCSRLLSVIINQHRQLY